MQNKKAAWDEMELKRLLQRIHHTGPCSHWKEFTILSEVQLEAMKECFLVQFISFKSIFSHLLGWLLLFFRTARLRRNWNPYA